MAAGGERRVTNGMIVCLAEAISAQNMESIALTYMGIEWEMLQNLRREHREEIEAFNRDVIRRWCNKKSSGPDQIGVNSE